jgi:hypothetical protein
MYRIAVNTAKNHLAAQRRRPMDVELDLQDPEQYDLHAKLKETDTPEGVTLGNELRETVERAIAALPEDPARTGRHELRRDSTDHGVPGWHRTVENFQGTRCDRKKGRSVDQVV